MQEVLLAWIGAADLKAPDELATSGMGPIAQALTALRFNTAYLLSNYPGARTPPYLAWLEPQTTAAIEVVTDGNKTQAAALLGLPSYQTLTNWLKKHGGE